MREWRFDSLRYTHDGRDRSRDGSHGSGLRRGPYRLRHVQGAGQRYRDPRSRSRTQIRRQERRIQARGQTCFSKEIDMPSNVNMLLVDDNPVVRDMLRKAFEPLAHVTAVCNGEEALESST